MMPSKNTATAGKRRASKADQQRHESAWEALLFGQAQLAVARLDATGAWLRCNPACQAALKLAGPPTGAFTDLVAPEDRATFQTALMAVMAAPGTPRDFTLHSITHEALRARLVALAEGEGVALTLSPTPAQQAPHASDQIFQRLMSANIIGIITADEQRILAANAYFLEMLGYTRGELESGALRWREMTPATFLGLDEKNIALLRETGVCPPFAKAYFHKDGHIVPVVLGAALLEAEPMRWVCFVLDQSRQVDLEERERRSDHEAQTRLRQLEAVFAAMRTGVALYDREANIIMRNQALEEMLGLTARPDFFTMSLEERERVLYACDTAGARLARERLPQIGVLSATTAGERSTDMRIHTADGREIWVSATAAPILDANGAVEGAIVVYHDFTSRWWLEERTRTALRALLEMERSLIAPLGQFTEDATNQGTATLAGRLAQLTRAFLGCQRVAIAAMDPQTERLRPVTSIGLNESHAREWLSRPISDLSPESNPNPELLRRLIGGEVLEVDMTEPRFAQQDNPFGVRKALIALMRLEEQPVGVIWLDFGAEDHVYTADEKALVGAVANLGALVMMRERLLVERDAATARELALRETNQRMQTFLGVAGHEMRTPITAIKTSIQLALRDITALASASGDAALPLERPRARLQRADLLTNKLTRLIEDLLDATRIQSGLLELEPVAADLGTITREAVEIQRAAWPDRAIALDVAATDLTGVFDPDRIGQVITNFLTNALKYSDLDAPVAVRVWWPDDATLRVEVRDAGPGLAAEQQRRLWEPYYQVEGITQVGGAGKGLGLGLYICRTIVLRHGGQVGVQSAPGEGSTFWFTLPRVPHE